MDEAVSTSSASRPIAQALEDVRQLFSWGQADYELLAFLKYAFLSFACIIVTDNIS